MENVKAMAVKKSLETEADRIESMLMRCPVDKQKRSFALALEKRLSKIKVKLSA